MPINTWTVQDGIRCLSATVSANCPAFNPVCHLVKGNHREEILRLAVSLEADLVVVGATAR
ncbi:MAG: hypothetical protein QNI91_09985 [Arenicellales bacterium]|nr:hypothetical protein [Arenicellales bacterium]